MNYYTSQIPPTLAEKLKEKGETMTSEEKAKELVSEANTIDLLNRMAAWKDKQFKDIIAQVRKWLDEQCKLDQLDLVEFDMRIEECWERRK